MVDLTDLAWNHTKMLEYARVGSIEVCDPVTERPIQYEELEQILKNVVQSLGEDVKFDTRGIQQDPVAGSNEMNAAPGIPIGVDPEATEEDKPRGDPTLPNGVESALVAAIDQRNAEMAGEANPPPSVSGSAELADETPAEETSEEATESSEEGYTEEDLLAMKMDDLKVLAVETYGCDEETISKLRSKKEVVAAILDAAQGEE